LGTEWLDKFDAHLQVERRLSPLTRENYRRDLLKLAAFCEKQAIADWRNLNTHHLRAFIAAEHRAGLGGHSLQRVLSAVRTFFDFLVREDILSMNPATGIRAPKSAKHLPKTLDTDQTGRLLAFSADTRLAQRDLAMMELFYSSGLRLSELVNLNLGDFDLADGSVTVTGKGNKTRKVPVGQHARKAVEHWLQTRAGFTAPEEPALFVNQRGRRLTPRSVQLRLRQWSIKQGLNMPLHPHMLRHSCASHVLESSGDLRAVQELLGHADISTTQIYTHLDFQHLAEVYDKAHPRARRKKS
jgi:integrase/recombinase XerC